MNLILFITDQRQILIRFAPDNKSGRRRLSASRKMSKNKAGGGKQTQINDTVLIFKISE